VKLPPFAYFAPSTLEETLALLREHGDESKLLAGGQSLVPLLALRLARPSVLVDLGHVAGLDHLAAGEGSVTIGAMVTERRAERSEVVGAQLPLLAEAMPLIGHQAIRNRGTVGGSIAHADPSAELPAVAVALEAEMVAESAQRGRRTIPAESFFQGFFTTALEPDEVLVELRLPAGESRTGVAFEEAARRHGDFAMVGAAVVLRVESDRIADARIALAGVADTPLRRPEAERALRGEEVTAEAFEDAATAAARDLSPPSDLHGTAAYRRHLARVLVRRALVRAAQRLGVSP